jgi:hypothetical protein
LGLGRFLGGRRREGRLRMEMRGVLEMEMQMAIG